MWMRLHSKVVQVFLNSWYLGIKGKPGKIELPLYIKKIKNREKTKKPS